MDVIIFIIISDCTLSNSCSWPTSAGRDIDTDTMTQSLYWESLFYY